MNRTSDERLRLWVDQMRDVCFDAEDVVDDFMFRVDHMRQQRLNNLKCLRPLPQCIGFGDKLLLVHDLKARMENINITVEKILVNKTRYGIENPKDLETWSFTKEEDLPPTEKVGVVPDRNVGEVDFVGMQSQVECVRDQLLTGTGVVSILGMGGLGKTTLARRVYNDRNVKRHFDCRVWVSVSQEYRIGELLMRIANSVLTPTPQQRRRVKETELGNTLRDSLKSKTYLIVLDDLWSPQVLVDLSSHFPESDKSRMLITTRIPEVAHHAPSYLHEIRPLSFDDSWELFLSKVFRVTTTKPIKVQSDLEELREAVVDKCQGSPLSIALLGGLLSGKQKTPESWNQVLQSIKRHGDDHQPFYLWILSWSYNDLPFYLKSCFLYCGLFPEDHEISARKLINLWIAEGFVQKRGEETLEEVGEDYLAELIQRSLILVGKRRLDGGVRSCYIHDMVRDFLISEAKQSRLFEVCHNIKFTTPLSPRRLSFHDHHAINHSISQHLNSSRLRSLICFSTECLGQKGLDSLIQGSKLLTVLDLSGLGGINELPKKIGKLIHLKYLSLRDSKIARLPKSIGKLVNLQALDLRDSSIERIPHTIWKLRQLRQLYGGTGVVFSPFMGGLLEGHLGFGELTNLQILAIKWGGWVEDGGLGKLTQLRKLKIQGSKDLPSFQVTPFSCHTYLYKLFLKGRLNKLPEETTFYPPNLVKLKLKYSKLEADPMLTLKKLPNLRILQLLSSSYLGRKLVCSFEGFLKLESLTLSDLSELEELSLKEGAMRGLRSLKIEGCGNMRGLVHGLFHLQNLQQLKLKRVHPELTEELDLAEGEDLGRIRSITRKIQEKT